MRSEYNNMISKFGIAMWCFSIILLLLVFKPNEAYAAKDTWNSILVPSTVDTSKTFRALAIHPTKPDTLFAGN